MIPAVRYRRCMYWLWGALQLDTRYGLGRWYLLSFSFSGYYLFFPIRTVSILLVNTLLLVDVTGFSTCIDAPLSIDPSWCLQFVVSWWWGFASMLFFYRQYTTIFSSSDTTFLLLLTTRVVLLRRLDPYSYYSLSSCRYCCRSSCIMTWCCWHTRYKKGSRFA